MTAKTDTARGGLGALAAALAEASNAYDIALDAWVAAWAAAPVYDTALNARTHADARRAYVAAGATLDAARAAWAAAALAVARDTPEQDDQP